MQLVHEMYSDYERLLHANPQRGYGFFYSALLNPSLREPMLTGEASLQAIFCGCNEKGQAIFPNAYNINDLLVDEGYMDQALGNYLAFLGYANPGNDWATFLKNNYAAIFADKAALAAILQSKTAMQLFVSDSTLWSAILASTTRFRRCMCSYYFCGALAATPSKFADIRASASILTAFNTSKNIITATKVITAAQSGTYFVMIIGAGGAGGAGGHISGGSCCRVYNDAASGATGSVKGQAGKARYAHYTGTSRYKNAGGGGGRGGVAYYAIRVKRGDNITCTMAAVPSVTGYDARSTLAYAAVGTQGQTLPDIDTSSDSTATTAAAIGYGGYGYGTPASGNNFLGTLSAAAGADDSRNTSDRAGAGGKGVGAGGGGGAGGSSYAGGAGAAGCIGLYVGA